MIISEQSAFCPSHIWCPIKKRNVTIVNIYYKLLKKSLDFFLIRLFLEMLLIL